jgi:hypothetical protein
MSLVHRFFEQSQPLDIVIGKTSAIAVGSLRANRLITGFPTPNQVRLQPCFRRNVFDGVGGFHAHVKTIKKRIANVNIMFNICLKNLRENRSHSTLRGNHENRHNEVNKRYEDDRIEAKTDAQDIIPILPVRNMVAFPQMSVPFMISFSSASHD